MLEVNEDKLQELQSELEEEKLLLKQVRKELDDCDIETVPTVVKVANTGVVLGCVLGVICGFALMFVSLFTHNVILCYTVFIIGIIVMLFSLYQWVRLVDIPDLMKKYNDCVQRIKELKEEIKKMK